MLYKIKNSRTALQNKTERTLVGLTFNLFCNGYIYRRYLGRFVTILNPILFIISTYRPIVGV